MGSSRSRRGFARSHSSAGGDLDATLAFWRDVLGMQTDAALRPARHRLHHGRGACGYSFAEAELRPASSISTSARPEAFHDSGESRRRPLHCAADASATRDIRGRSSARRAKRMDGLPEGSRQAIRSACVATPRRDSNGAAHENRHLEHQRRPGPPRAAVTWLTESAPDVACLQEIKIGRRAFPRAELRGRSATTSQRTARRASTASPCCPSCRFDEVPCAACRATTRTSRRASSKACSRRDGRAARRLALPAQRQSDRRPRSSPTSWPGWSGCERRPRELLTLEEPLVLAGDYNVIPEPIDAKNPRAWLDDALFQPETRQAFRAARSTSASPTPCAPVTERPASTPSGTTRPAPGRRTTASASTTCCCRRRPPTALVGRRIDKHTRAWEKPSDHVPVAIELELQPA